MNLTRTREALEEYLALDGDISGGFTGAPQPRLISCDPEAMELTLSYDIPDWMVNPWGVVHGGLTTALIDSTFGLLAAWSNNGVVCPTVSMNSNYLSAVRSGAPLIVSAKVERFGRVCAHLSAQCNQNGKLTTTASAVFSTASPREFTAKV